MGADGGSEGAVVLAVSRQPSAVRLSIAIRGRLAALVISIDGCEMKTTEDAEDAEGFWNFSNEIDECLVRGATVLLIADN